MRPHSWSSRTLLVVALMGGALVALALVGCATIMQGTTQNVGIGSSPTGATVSLDGKPLGTTPVVGKLSRKDNHVVRLEMPGFLPYETAVSRHVSGWVWGNIVFGGIPGLAIDAISGGLYKLTPDQIQGEMKKEGSSLRLQDDMILIAVTMHPDPAWVKVGTLTPDSAR